MAVFRFFAPSCDKELIFCSLSDRLRGQDCLGFETKSGRALSNDEETSEELLLDRLAEVIRVANADAHVGVDVISGASFSLRDQNDLIQLVILIAGKYQIVILAALSDFMAGAGENAVKDTT